MIITIFWISLTLALICILLSEVIQVFRQKKYIKLLSESTGISKEVNNLSKEEQLLKLGMKALNEKIEGFGTEYLVTYNSLLDEMSEQLAGQSVSDKVKQIRAEIKHQIKNGTAIKSSLQDKDELRRASLLVLEAFNCKVESSLNKLKSTNVGNITAEIKNSFDIINMNSIGLKTSIEKSYLKMRIDEAKLGAILHEERERQKEQQRALKEDMREEERVNREQERLAKEIEYEEKIKEAMLKEAMLKANEASEADKAIYEQRVFELQAEVDAVKMKAQRVSMAQLTKVGTVYIISNIGSFGEGILKIGMTRRLNPKDRIDELSSASVPFEFDVHSLINTTDAPKLESELHNYFNDRRVNKVNLKKEFFKVDVSEVKEVLSQKGIKAEFSLVAEAKQFKESQEKMLLQS